MKLQIGIIGYKNHALRLIKLISQNKYSELKFIYHPDKKVNHVLATNKLQDLYSCDAVIISSPSQTHFDYIVNLLANFDGYIFCEKPPVCHLADLKALSKIPDSDKNRIYFNYNLRFGLVNSVMSDSYYQEKLGKVHNIKILTGHGLAFKKDYANSWRADGKHNLHAITETLAIHYIDLLLFKYGQINKYFYSPSIVANTGTAYDTVHMSLVFDNITASIFASYACPLIDEISIIGTEGILKICEGQLYLYHPRDIFDDNGFFKEPPLVQKYMINKQREYDNTLEKSLDFFIYHVVEGKAIEAKYFEASLASNRFLLEIQD